MGLKNKNSIFDLSNGPVSDMETQQGPQFQRTIDEATDKSIASLGEVPATTIVPILYGRSRALVNASFNKKITKIKS